jgi:hypothetical protein
MKITIENEGKEEVFEDVMEFVLTGVKGKGQIEDFYTYSGNYKHLMEKAHSIHEILKHLFLIEE